MPDSRPDPDESGAPVPSSGSRRSGLDRLRAARVGADAGGAAGADPAPSDRPVGAGRAGGTDRGAGSTALLDTTTDSDTATDSETAADADTSRHGSTWKTPADADAPVRRRRGLRRSKTAAGAATAPTRRREQAGQPPAVVARTARLQVAAAVVLGLVVIALAVPVVLMRHRIIGETSDQKAVSKLIDKRTAATDAARRFAITFFSPNYKSIDTYSNQVAALSTGGFLSDFNSKRGQLKSVTTQVQSVATGHVLAAGVSNVSGATVQVLVVADQDVQNTTTKGKAQTQRYRVRITEQQTPKGWLVSDLEPVV